MNDLSMIERSTSVIDYLHDILAVPLTIEGTLTEIRDKVDE